MRRVIVNGKEVSGQQVQFATLGEPWAEYRLEDGSTARVKCVLTRLVRTDEKMANGDTIYTFDVQPILMVDEPDKSAVN